MSLLSPFRVKEKPASLQAQRDALKKATSALGKKVEDMNQIMAGVPYEKMPPAELQEYIRDSSAESFIDPDFPPCDASLYR